MTDEAMMRLALDFARRAQEVDEVPIGAVIAAGDRVIAAAHNERELAHDPTAHAEMLALARASRLFGAWRLDAVTIYVTLEPCAMCAGALVNARVARLVYGADDPKAGAVRSLFRIADDPRLNHRLEIERGVLAEECGGILRDYFRRKRARRGAGAFFLRDATLADAEEIARVHIASWRSGYRGLIAEETLANLSLEKRRGEWEARIAGGPFRLLLAIEKTTGELVAFSAFGPALPPETELPGEVGAIYSLERVQGRGVGRMLLSAALEDLSARDLLPAIVWVFRDNANARRFYEALGGRAIREGMIEIGGIAYAKVAYRFDPPGIGDRGK